MRAEPTGSCANDQSVESVLDLFGLQLTYLKDSTSSFGPEGSFARGTNVDFFETTNLDPGQKADFPKRRSLRRATTGGFSGWDLRYVALCEQYLYLPSAAANAENRKKNADRWQHES